jgi:hypothetical protein
MSGHRRALYRLALAEHEFRDLVAGRVIVCDVGGRPVEIVLGDIGAATMMRAVLDGTPARPPDPPQAREFLPRKPKG